MGKLQNKVGGIHFRVLMLVTGLIAMLMATQLLSHTAIEVRNQQNDRLSEALTLTNLVARNLESHFGQFQQSDVEGILSSVYVHENVKRVAVIDKQQAFYLDVESDGSEAEIETDIPEMIVALETGEIAHSISGNTITVAQPLFRDEKSIGSLSIRFDNPGVAAVAIPIMLSNMKFSVPILLLGVLLSTLLVRQITVPLKRLAESTASVSNGDLNCVVPIEGPPEIRQLGASFSAMLAKLKSNIEQVYELAYVDKITKLPNREYFREELNRSIRRSIRQDTIGALLFVDLDGFKKVNDTHGHDCGDELLEKFSERLTKVLRAEDVIAFKGGKPNVGLDDEDEATNSNQVLARLGGDEFTVLLSDLREATDAALVSQRIIDVVSQPFEVGDTEVRIGASIGIAIFPRDGSDYDAILKSADMAMYQAKEEGKNTFRFYSDELNQEASHRSQIEQDLRKALQAGDQFELYYQPKIETKSGTPSSVEALIRWKHPEKGMIPPLEFIGIAEDCGLIAPIGRWVLEEACKQINRFAGLGMDISIAVNISTAQFNGENLSKVVMEILAKTGANPARLELELTESMAMQNPDAALTHIMALKNLGVRFAIDDFGTGYSNLSQLSRMPFDVFKIDRTFVDMLANKTDAHGRVIVRTILAMANSLNYDTVAEGIETIGQLEFMTEYGCTFAQGYYFARPMPANDFVLWYRQWEAMDAGQIASRLRQGIAV